MIANGIFGLPQPFLGNSDIFDWHPKFQSCVRYFLDVAQHTSPVQAVAAYVNIQLPSQRPRQQILSSAQVLPHTASPGPAAGGSSPSARTTMSMSMSMPPGSPTSYVTAGAAPSTVTLLPYIRRLVATGFDAPGVLHGFFGDDWREGVGPLHEAERQNYLFAAKSDTWLHVKADYDMDDGQTIPFMRPLNATEEEIEGAEASWSEWLAMQDWMLGPRAPQIRVKRERE
ncbi:ilp is an apoptosis inhibitor [Ceratocystis lukuohia]|uniref:Ilp is an apoptosis inhibitor n=3 Tax=Ceratocystis TaxID=5157 RepID=A0A0F8AZ66_CERFI|nr:hypothetical protein CFO_g5517 [Ceratocystis platani]PHH53169.1 hypothetical protein CFIMG_008278RA00001 [Ceratocystis fimbriata CBS 114723]